MTDRSTFVRGYTKILTNAWSDESFMERLKSNPKEVVGEYGLETNGGNVEIVTQTSGEGNLDDQVRLWEEGATSGTYTLYVPEVPQIETQELSESELEGVAGGDDYCCCCSPCCTCT